MSGIPTTKPLMDGYTAREDGAGVEACPTGAKPLMRDAWKAGWHMADEHIRADQSEAMARALASMRRSGEDDRGGKQMREPTEQDRKSCATCQHAIRQKRWWGNEDLWCSKAPYRADSLRGGIEVQAAWRVVLVDCNLAWHELGAPRDKKAERLPNGVTWESIPHDD